MHFSRLQSRKGAARDKNTYATLQEHDRFFFVKDLGLTNSKLYEFTVPIGMLHLNFFMIPLV